MSDSSAHMRARFSVPADRDLPPGRHLLHRENLMSQILNEPPSSQPGNSEPSRDRRPSPRRSPAWHPSARGLLATAAAVALVAGLGVTASEKLSAHPDATATAVLDRIAQAAAAGPAVHVGPNQDFYVKATVTVNSPLSIPVSGKITVTPLPSKPVTEVVEGWIAQSPAKETLWKIGGHSTILGSGTGFSVIGDPITGDFFGDLTKMAGSSKLLYATHAYLQSLPTNPRQLLSLIKQQVPSSLDKNTGTFLGDRPATVDYDPAAADRGRAVSGGSADSRSDGCARRNGCARPTWHWHRPRPRPGGYLQSRGVGLLQDHLPVPRHAFIDQLGHSAT